MRIQRSWTFKPSYLALCLTLFFTACAHKPKLLIDTVDTVPEPGPIHLAFVKSNPGDQRNVELAACFAYEPGIEWYGSVETYRFLRERQIAARGIQDIREPRHFAAMKDFDLLLVAVPRGRGILLRSFYPKQQRLSETFVATGKVNCEELYRTLGLLKVVSFPDGAHIFVDGRYYGISPRWVQLAAGRHQLRLESFDGKIGEQEVLLPDQVQIVIQADQDKKQQRSVGKRSGLGDVTAYVLGGLLGAALIVVPLILLL